MTRQRELNLTAFGIVIVMSIAAVPIAAFSQEPLPPPQCALTAQGNLPSCSQVVAARNQCWEKSIQSAIY